MANRVPFQRLFLAACLVSVVAVAGLAARAAEPIKLADVAELSGSGAPVGNNWKNAIEMAVAEINAKGGVLGRPLALSHYDTQTNAGVSRAVIQKALDEEPYVILGPIYSSATMVDMELTRAARVPEITGGAAAAITTQGNPYIFRITLGQASGIPKLVNYLSEGMKAKSAALLWVNDDYGKGGHDVLVKELAARGITLAVDVSSEAGQADFSADVIKVTGAAPDAVVVYLHEEESARFLKEARKEGVKTPIVGDTTLLDPKVIQLAGDAANGARGHLSLSAGAPIEAVQQFAAKFSAKYGNTPDHNAIQGYMAVYTVKAVTEKIGKVDRQAFADTLHGLTITPQMEPGILMETGWDASGDDDRASFIAEILDGKQKIIATLPRLHH